MPASAVHRQVAKASNRLFIQKLLDHVVWCWAGALLLAALWFFAQPWVTGSTDEMWRWGGAGAMLIVGSGVAFYLAFLRAPSHVTAALELDERFKLKERITTSLTLAPDLAETPAGQALLADADTHAAKVNVRERFPVRLAWTALMVPVCAAVLALVAIFYNPVFEDPIAIAAAKKEAEKVVNAKLIEEKFNALKKPTTLSWPKDEPKSDKLEEIQQLIDKLQKQNFDTTDKDKVRDKLQQTLPIQDKIKDRIDELKAAQDRDKALRDKLKDPDQQLGKDGPAKGVQDAFNDGDLDKARQEMQELADKLKNDKLDEEERKKLKDQLEEMKNRLDNMADPDQKDLEQKLKKDLDDGRITKEQFDKKMAEAKEAAEKMDNAKELSKQIGEAKDQLDKGDPKGAGEKLEGAAKGMQPTDPKGNEMKQLQQDQQRLQDLQKELQKGLGQGGPPDGERPMGKDAKVGSKDAKAKGDLDTKGKLHAAGEQKGGKFDSKIPADQLGKAFQKAQQILPEEIERQQVPPDAAELVRGFYENMAGGQKKQRP
jgi:hypothetical protein